MGHLKGKHACNNQIQMIWISKTADSDLKQGSNTCKYFLTSLDIRKIAFLEEMSKLVIYVHFHKLGGRGTNIAN